MYECMYLCMYGYMYVCMYVCAYIVHMYVLFIVMNFIQVVIATPARLQDILENHGTFSFLSFSFIYLPNCTSLLSFIFKLIRHKDARP